MNPRRVAITLGAVGVVAAASWWAVTEFAPQGAIDIDQAQLQARLDARFPQRNCTMLVACLTLSAPVVVLAEGSNRIGLSADVLVTLGHREMPGKVAFSGVLRYVRYQGDFYLDDVQIDNFALTGFPPELVQVVKVRGPAAMRRALEGHPIYTLKGDSARAALAKLAVRDVLVVDGKVRVTFLRFGG
ncbi:MAG: DUF1439 domain-containing protein [Betaproteobacteria bacterium]